MSDYYRYEVQGKGDFPWDMLRYDRVWPLTEPSPSRYVVDDWKSPKWTELRIVEVQGNNCTADRWASFGWHVRWTTMAGPWPATGFLDGDAVDDGKDNDDNI